MPVAIPSSILRLATPGSATSGATRFALLGCSLNQLIHFIDRLGNALRFSSTKYWILAYLFSGFSLCLETLRATISYGFMITSTPSPKCCLNPVGVFPELTCWIAIFPPFGIFAMRSSICRAMGLKKFPVYHLCKFFQWNCHQRKRHFPNVDLDYYLVLMTVFGRDWPGGGKTGPLGTCLNTQVPLLVAHTFSPKRVKFWSTFRLWSCCAFAAIYNASILLITSDITSSRSARSSNSMHFALTSSSFLGFIPPGATMRSVSLKKSTRECAWLQKLLACISSDGQLSVSMD